jgi:hypothetical protein
MEETMRLSIVPLLLADRSVPEPARRALEEATREPDPQVERDARLRAARILHRELDLECRDAVELVGLAASDCR